MAAKRRTYTAAFKAQVALAALRGDKTVNELATQHSVHPTLINAWKKQLVTGAEGVFSSGAKGDSKPDDVQAELYEQIGRLKMELEWLKKNAPARPVEAAPGGPGPPPTERPAPVPTARAEPLHRVV
jgi:putative transposase